MILKKT